MPLAWPIAKFLFKVVVPSIPEIISTVSKLKHEEEAVEPRNDTLDKRLTEIEQQLAQHLELIENLTREIATLQLILRRTLIISLVALGLALTGLLLFAYS